jgi:hypothetical protein
LTAKSRPVFNQRVALIAAPGYGLGGYHRLERCRLLIAALAAAEAFDDVQRVHRQLEEVEKKE